ncbi:hypothetical protein ABL78_7349 [Leptomonas seymouri]|uniref:Uncharacterized protein n=1 Tax=Leptomonas seymouri TaxID=5684 RepID=A0A0N1IH98_LEPSE|nr:hypothetical protein ABL78_7349 [Leptomonas seymouri]|eukprot:KPI83611.1 hypothetical protein ABL78_7349 [Leptomonas seymouri]
MQSARPWTYSAYNIAAVVNFTAAVAAEVRRQEDVYDETAETLRVQKERTDFEFMEAKKKRYPPDSQLYREDVNNYLADSEKILSDDLARLKDAYPLGYEGVDPEGALGTYKLRATLLRHIEHIEAKRRATAVAAGDGTSSSAVMNASGWTSSALVKAEDDWRGGAPQRSDAPSPSSTAVLGVLKGAVEEINICVSEHHDRHPQPRHAAENNDSLISTTEPTAVSRNTAVDAASHALVQIKTEMSGGPSTAFPPSWASLKTEGRKVVPADWDNGAYLTPHPTAPGAPFPRYKSVPHLSSSASLPSFVVPACTPNPAAGTSHKKIPSSVTSTRVSAFSKRSVPSPSPPPHRPNSAPLASQRAASSAHSRGKSSASSAVAATAVTCVSRADADKDKVMQLWWRLWPGQRPRRSTCVGDHGDGGTWRTDSVGGAVRPTVVMVKAVASVAQKNLDRERARCAAQQLHVTGLLEKLKSKEKPGACESGNYVDSAHFVSEHLSKRPNANAMYTRRCRRRKTEAQDADQRTTNYDLEKAGSEDDLPTAASHLRVTPETPSAEVAATEAALVAQHRQLKKEMEQLATKQAAHERLVEELLDAIKSTPAPTQPRPFDGIEAAEVDLLRGSTTITTATQQGIRRHASSQQGGRDASPRHHSTAASTVAPPQQQFEVSHGTPLDSETVASHKRELLRNALLHPCQLITQLQRSRDADTQWHTTQPDESVFTHSTATVESITLPSIEEDRRAADLDAYMWPSELEARIQHKLHACTDMSGRVRYSYHVALSQDDVRILEKFAVAGATVDYSSHISPSQDGAAATSNVDTLSALPPDLDSHVVALPKSGMHGWLYVQGRGEIITAAVTLS